MIIERFSFICRKAAWILLKDEKSSDFVEAIECAVNLGKNSAKWLLANSIQNPNLSLVGEVHQSLFELELARNILAVFKGLVSFLYCKYLSIDFTNRIQ